MGFTSEKVKSLIAMIDQIEHKDKTFSDMRRMVRRAKQYYDGYRFSRRAVHHVFNPNMTLYYLDSFQSTGQEPIEIVDRNIFSDYAKLEQLLYIHNERKIIQRMYNYY